MPDMDGCETAICLRQQGFAQSILVLSANAYAADRLNAINAGCNDFLAKPLQVPELLFKLKLHLGLTWLYDEDEMEITPKTLPQALAPPTLILQALRGFVRIGDLKGFNHYLTEFSQNNPVHQDVTAQWLTLSREYRLSDLKKQLNMTTEPPPND